MNQQARHGGSIVTTTRPSRCAVLVFAESAALSSFSRGWGSQGITAAGAMVNHAIAIARRSNTGDVHVFTRSQFPNKLADVPSPGLRWHRQQGNTFGRRLEAAVESIRQLGYDRVVIVGTDVPGLRAAHVRQAARLLDSSPMALGADQRGGCYTIALHLTHAAVLSDVTWGQDTDFAELLSRQPAAAVLPQRLRDIDCTADLHLELAQPASRLPQRLLAALRSALQTSFAVPQLLTASWHASLISAKPALFVARRMWQLPPPVAA